MSYLRSEGMPYQHEAHRGDRASLVSLSNRRIPLRLQRRNLVLASVETVLKLANLLLARWSVADKRPGCHMATMCASESKATRRGEHSNTDSETVCGGPRTGSHNEQGRKSIEEPVDGGCDGDGAKGREERELTVQADGRHSAA